MTLEVIKAWMVEVQPRYREAERKRKLVILDEFCDPTGYHCRAEIRLLNRRSKQEPAKRRGRPPIYRGKEFVSALLLVWEASGLLCRRYLHPALPQLLDRMASCGELILTSEYDTPTTPNQRLLATDRPSEERRAGVVARYRQISPLKLECEIGQAIKSLWQMEVPDPASQRARERRQAAREAASK